MGGFASVEVKPGRRRITRLPGCEAVPDSGYNPWMNASKTQVSRPMVGALAVACLLAWGGMFALPERSNSTDLWHGAFLRIGVVMIAFYVSLPSRKRDAAWSGIKVSTLAAAAFLAFLTARLRFAIVPIAIAIVTIGLYLRPRDKRRPGTRPV